MGGGVVVCTSARKSSPAPENHHQRQKIITSARKSSPAPENHHQRQKIIASARKSSPAPENHRQRQKIIASARKSSPAPENHHQRQKIITSARKSSPAPENHHQRQKIITSARKSSPAPENHHQRQKIITRPIREGSPTLQLIAPEGHVSPETEQVSSPGSASSTHLEEHDDEDDDDDDDDDAAIDTQIQASDHEEVPIETVLPPNRPATTTYDAIVASKGKIVEAENHRHSDLMTVLERMIALQEETVSQLAHLHRVFIEVPKQLQKINTSFEALVVQQTQANYLRMTNVPQFNLNTSQAGSVHAGQFSPHASDLHSPGPNVTGQVADIAVQVPDDILPLPSVQNQQLTPTKEATKTKHKQLLLTSFWSKTKKDTHETDQPSLVQCLPTCSHVSVGTSPVGESLATSPVREQSLPTSPVSESLPKSPVGEQSLPKSPVGEQSLPKSPVGESLPKSPVGEQSLPKSPVGESLATSPAREVPEASQSGSVVAKVVAKRKRKIQETTSRPVTRSQKEQKK
ncbi:uncharacterized protein LOC142465421 [Ascaphus truei]|uniref:uncharacterized protein LOC142465421 n=1 Tax=Ascaphus truei TaxID=8439 RepID=UPI003F5AA451